MLRAAKGRRPELRRGGGASPPAAEERPACRPLTAIRSVGPFTFPQLAGTRSFVHDSYDPTTNLGNVYVGSLRKKLGAEVIPTVRGFGYRLRGR
jgi:hypothetical protein